MDFVEFINLATALVKKEDPRKEVSLALLKELCRATFQYVHTIPKETRNKAYILSAFKTIQKKIKKAEEKSKHKLNYAFIAIFEVGLKVLLDAKSSSIIDAEILAKVVLDFHTQIQEQLKTLLHDLRKAKVVESQDTQLTILSIVDALSTLKEVNLTELASMQKDAAKFWSSDKSDLNVGARLENFMFSFLGRSSVDNPLSDDVELSGDVKTVYGRKSLVQKAKILTEGDNQQKLRRLNSLFGAEMGGLRCPDKLLAARQIIISLEGRHSILSYKISANNSRRRQIRRRSIF